MRAGVITLRIADRLIGLRADTAETLRRLRLLFADWIDDDLAVEWALDVRLDPDADDDDASGDRRGPTAIPQLRLGRTVIARSRNADEVVAALAGYLGGLHAHRSDPDRCWLGMRLLVHGETALLLDVPAPMLLGDRTLERRGVDEVTTWTVAVERSDDGGRPTVRLPGALTGLDWSAVGIDPVADHERPFVLNGLVGLDNGASQVGSNAAAAVLARFGTRHPSTDWFSTVAELVEADAIRLVERRPAALRQAVLAALR